MIQIRNVLLSVALVLAGCSTAVNKADSEWISYGGDPGGMRYAAADQINRDNVAQLEQAWSYRTGAGEKVPQGTFVFHSLHATPLLTPVEAGQSIVFCSDFNRIIALDPVTGAERWVFDPQVNIEPFGQYKCRGVSIWHDTRARSGAACEWRVYTATSDRRLFAVDVRNGERCADFGVNGEVDINPLIRATEPEGDIKTVQFWAPPAIVGEIVAVSATVHSKGKQVRSYPGRVRGFDTRSGELQWWFDPVPRNPNDPEAANWSAEALANTGSASAWAWMSVDEERDLLFVPTSDASPDYYGGTRPGDNRYATSLVVLKGSTGKPVWHFQFTHHDVWNYDPAAQPLLTELTRAGVTQPVVVQTTKAGMVWVLDRDTGEPVFGFEERPVPTDGVPGEVLSPTQPFPLAPPPLSPTKISPDDAWGLDAADREFCREAIASRRHGSIYEPPSLGGTIMFPQPGGGVNWGGGAFDPSRNLLITNISIQADSIRLIPTAELDMKKATGPGAGRPGGLPGYINGTDYGVQIGPLVSPSGVLCTAPPWSKLVAVDLAAGTVRWEVPLGATSEYADRGAPLIEGITAMGGPLVTGGGLIFIGATKDEKFRAFATDTGELLWEFDLPSAAMANPMSYAINGRQYVVIAAGGHQFFHRENVTDYLLAFALDE